jgi:hypothetical protein
MFGMMLGTLAKFQSEESERRDLMLKRNRIERRLEDKQEKELEELDHQHKELMRDKKLKEAEMKRVESKMIRIQGFDVWEKNATLLSSHFIQTKSKPCIFFAPKIMTPEMEKKQKATRDKYRVIIAEKRAKVQKDFSEIEQTYEREVEALKDTENRVTEAKIVEEAMQEEGYKEDHLMNEKPPLKEEDDYTDNPEVRTSSSPPSTPKLNHGD